MLKSWVASPFHRASDATTSAPNTPYTAPVTLAASSGRSCQRPEKARTEAQIPSSMATQSENWPSKVMASGFRFFVGGFVAGPALGQHLGGAEHPVAAEPALHDHLDVVGVGEGIGDQT